MTDSAPAEVPNPTKMLRWEQQLGYVVAGVAGAGAVLMIATNDALRGALALAATVALFWAVYHGQRIITALIGLPSLLLGVYVPVEFSLLAYLFYLMFRTSNAQSRIRRSQPRRSPAERRAETDQRMAERRAKRRGEVASAAKSPIANRRYTPPKPKVHRPATPPTPAAGEEAGLKDRIFGGRKAATTEPDREGKQAR